MVHLLPTPVDDLEKGMSEIYAQRAEKYSLELVPVFPDIREVKTPLVWGSHCWTLTALKSRWVPNWAVRNIGHGPQTGPEIARDYLSVKYAGRRKRAFRDQAAYFDAMPPMPLFIRPGRYADHAYVDIRAAYLSIMDLVGWDCDYNPGHWLIPGQPPNDFPLRKDKIARNALVTSALPLSLRIWTGETFIRRGGPNPLINKGLWAVISDTLHMIACIAFECQAVYFNTDGAILPAYQVDLYREVLWDIGLDTEIRAVGDANIRTYGNFRLGEWHTKLYDPGQPKAQDDSNLRSVDRAYLLKTLYKIRRYRWTSGG